jgi:lambda family phage portal protein
MAAPSKGFWNWLGLGKPNQAPLVPHAQNEAPLGGAQVPARNVPPGLEAGSVRRRLAVWQPTGQHINAQLRAAGDTINARARWLVRNNGYAKAALRSWSAATVGAGIKPSSLAEDEALREEIHAVWNDWTDEADAEQVTDFYGLTRRVSRETFLTGECFIRKRPRRPQDGLTVPLQLQMLPAEQLPLWRMDTAPNGNTVRLGVEFDRNLRDKRVAYWFYRHNPTDPTWTFRDALMQDQITRVPAEDIIHVFDPVEAGQVRGNSGYAAAIVKLFHLDAWDDAELERQKQQARYATFVELPEDATEIDEDGDPVNPLVPRRQDDDMAYAPGATVTMKPGEKVTFAQPGGTPSGYEAFQYRTLLQICAALGVPYAELSGDLAKATYASSRAGLLAYRAEVEAFQHAVLVYQFIRQVWATWFDTAVLARALPISASAYMARPMAYRAYKAIPPRAAWVDPLKDRQAAILALKAGLIAPQDVIEAEGYDMEEVYNRIAEAQALARKLGITIDYGTRTQTLGTSQPPGATASDGGSPADAEAA